MLKLTVYNVYISAQVTVFDFIATEGILSTLVVKNSFCLSIWNLYRKRDKIQNIFLSLINVLAVCSL